MSKLPAYLVKDEALGQVLIRVRSVPVLCLVHRLSFYKDCENRGHDEVREVCIPVGRQRLVNGESGVGNTGTTRAYGVEGLESQTVHCFDTFLEVEVNLGAFENFSQEPLNAPSV